jgi:hypothetical protein
MLLLEAGKSNAPSGFLLWLAVLGLSRIYEKQHCSGCTLRRSLRHFFGMLGILTPIFFAGYLVFLACTFGLPFQRADCRRF